MNKREVVRLAIQGKRPSYVPWDLGFTFEAREKMLDHYGRDTDLGAALGNHLPWAGGVGLPMEDLGEGHFRDLFGVVWDRSVDKDIGVIRGLVLPEPTLADLRLPDPLDPRFYTMLRSGAVENIDGFRVFSIGFSLYERAWTLRGMENLMMDFRVNPEFAHALLDAIADFNVAAVREAVKYDIDAVYFGDDWGQQRGLQMGYPMWREFILPRLQRMYGAVREAGKVVMIHSCGDVDELFDDLIAAGLNCFNPFQPEVMDVEALMRQYHGRLAFHGGLSTQRTLPYGTPDDVRRETRRLLELGRDGGYIFAPAHAVEGDVPLENMLAFVEVLHAQPGWRE